MNGITLASMIQFSQGRRGLDAGIELPWSFVALSEAFDRLLQEGDAMSTM
jgi:hypothetical protein